MTDAGKPTRRSDILGEFLRILLCLEPSGGGSGRHVADLAQGLCKNGHDVTLVHGTSRAEAGFVERINAIHGLKTVAEDSLVRPVGLHDLKALRRLEALVYADGPFDILHGHSSKAGALVRLLGRKLGGARIYTPHAVRTLDPGLNPFARWVYRSIETHLSRRTDHLIAVSRYEAEHLEGQAIAGPGQIMTIPNGASPRDLSSRAEVRALLNVDRHEIAVVQIGRLCPQKDPVRFVQAVGAAHRQRPVIRGFLIGDGELRDEVAAEVAITPGVTALGALDAAPLLGGFDLFMMTSRYEAFPYTFIEALHAGLPILTTRVGGADDVVDGANGLIVPVDAAPETLADALLMLSESDRRASAAAASAAAAESFTEAAMVAHTLEAYLQASGIKGVRP